MTASEEREALLVRYLEGPDVLEAALAELDEAVLDAEPPAGGWTIRQIVHHLADGDDLWKIGLKAALGETGDEFTLEWYWTQPQDAWAEKWAYSERMVEVSLALLRAIRIHVAQLLTCVPGAWDRSVALRKPDGEVVRLTVEQIVAMQTEHLEHHLRRIREIGGQ